MDHSGGDNHDAASMVSSDDMATVNVDGSSDNVLILAHDQPSKSSSSPHSHSLAQLANTTSNNYREDESHPSSSNPSSSSSSPCNWLLTVPSGRTLRSLAFVGLVSLASANLVLAAESISENCIVLPLYSAFIAVLCISGLMLAPQLRASVSLTPTPSQPIRSRLLRAAATLLLVLVVCVSAGAVEWLAEGACPSHRSIRQMAVANIVVVLSAAFAAFLFAFLRFHFPELQFQAFIKQTGKSILFFLALAAFVSCVVNLVSHPVTGRIIYHWGYTPRRAPCPVSCLDGTPADNSGTGRTLVCFNPDGDTVPSEFCESTVPEQKPAAGHDAAVECPVVDCKVNPRWAVHFDYSYDGNVPVNQFCSSVAESYFIRLGCWHDYAADPSRSEWTSNEECASGTGQTFPHPFTSVQIEKKLPPRPCPQACERLYISAIIYAIVFGCVCCGLAINLLCNQRFRAATASTTIAKQQMTNSQTNVAGESSQSVEDTDSIADRTFAANSGSGADESSRLYSTLASFTTAFWNFVARTRHTLRPWWRHLLVLMGCLILLGLALLSFVNLLWLANAHCRDYLISALANAIVTFIVAVVVANLLISNKQQVMQVERNPFELIGLLADEDEQEENELNGEVELQSSNIATERAEE